MMRGRTIGFIGFGRIARATLVRLANWNVRAIFFDPYVGRDAASHDGAIPAADLAALLRVSDIVNILVDLTAETHGMIGAAELAMMRRDAYLVNTARGAVVDEVALATALREGPSRAPRSTPSRQSRSRPTVRCGGSTTSSSRRTTSGIRWSCRSLHSGNLRERRADRAR